MMGWGLSSGAFSILALVLHASSAYLTVSEIFPLELRGLAITLFYSTGTALGGPLSSWLFGRLIDNPLQWLGVWLLRVGLVGAFLRPSSRA
jgi:hypothetical protein